MSQAKDSFFAAFGILACAGAALGGVLVRDRVETGAAQGQGLYASRTPGAQLTDSQEFDRLTQLLKAEFVDEPPSQQAMADGAVKGMIEALGDPQSAFFTPEELSRHQARSAGTFEGIGVDLMLRLDEDELIKAREEDTEIDALKLLPDVIVSYVATGSPAEKAGLRPGDRIDMIGEKWVMSAGPVLELREMQDDASADPTELSQLSRRLQAMGRTALNPRDVRERLMTGRQGSVQVTWERNGQKQSAEIAKAEAKAPAVQKQGDTIRLRLFTGASTPLKTILSGQSEATLDLRGSGLGDFSEVAPTFAVLAKGPGMGAVGKNQISVQDGRAEPLQLTLIVDDTTTGAALALARALVSHAEAVVQGKMPEARSWWLELHTLPTGAAYLLNHGEFTPEVKA
jgi:carboxyl-terminal processing protease